METLLVISAFYFKIVRPSSSLSFFFSVLKEESFMARTEAWDWS